MGTATISQLTSASPPVSGGELMEIERTNSSFKISLNTLKNWISTFIQTQITLAAQWQFDEATGASDPGSGKFRLDDGTPQVSASNIYVNDETEGGLDMGQLISGLSLGDTIYIQQREASNRALLFEVSGAPSDNGGWWTIPIQNGTTSSSPIENGQKCAFVFHFSS